MEFECIDLSALDPTRDEARWEALVRRIMDEATPELTRRATRNDPFALLGSWARPMIAAAASIAVVSLALLQRDSGPVELGATASLNILEALEVPKPAADWLAEDRAPTVADLVAALEADTR